MASFLPENNSPFEPTRRALLASGSLALLWGLAGCGSLPKGTGSGASAAASSLVTGIRSANGLSPLSTDSQLERAAVQQASYMAGAGRMAHTTGSGKDFASRVAGNGIKGAAAENIAEGRMDLQRLFDTWMNSPPHRHNLLDPRFTRFGLAYASKPRKPEWRYWALVLGT